MRKCGKGILLLMSAVMAASLFTGCGKDKSSQAQKNEVYATIKKSDQSASAAQICAWLSYSVKNNDLFQNEMMASAVLMISSNILDLWLISITDIPVPV